MIDFSIVSTTRETRVGNFMYRLFTDGKGNTTISRSSFGANKMPQWDSAMDRQTLSADGEFMTDSYIWAGWERKVMSFEEAQAYLQTL